MSPASRSDAAEATDSVLRDLSCAVATLNQQLADLRGCVIDLRSEVRELHQRVAARDEQFIVMRTQHRIMWAVTGLAGATGISALVITLLRLLKGAAP